MVTVKQVMRILPRLLPCLLMTAAIGLAGGSASWESHTFPDFVRGRFTGISLTRDGRLTLAPRLDPVFASGEAGVWSVAAATDGTLYLGTGHRGRLYRIAANGQASPIWTSPQPEIFALAAGARGEVYAGTSPDGRVWKIAGNQVTEFYNPKAKYIWSLAFAPDGSLYVATGDNGRIHRVAPDGKGEVWYETGQSHVTSLVVDARGRLVAGTEPNGIIYRVEGKDKAFVLYDSPLPEIRSLVAMPDGSIYAAALGGSVTQKQAQSATDAAGRESIPTVTTSITVTAEAAAQKGLEVKPKPDASKPQTPAFTEAPPPSSPVIDMSGVEKSAIYRIESDNMVETLWSSKEENVFDIAISGEDITFSTDQQGRIYRLTKELKSVLLVETREGETTRLLQQREALLAATSNLGKLFRLRQSLSDRGVYESPVHDAGNAARWGRIEWRAEKGSGSLAFSTRSGNSERPDKTWSDWSPANSDSTSTQVPSPNARYLQWQVELRGGGAVPPVLDSVTVTYQPRNGRPTVRSVQAYPQWVGDPSKAAAQTQSTGAAYSITVTDTGQATAAATSAGTPTQAMARSGRPQIYLSWMADDPEGDPLVYSVHFRAEDEREWKLLKDNLAENALAQDAEIFADGRYLFRVTASDRNANAAPSARESELVSQPVLIDLTPPRVTLAAPRRDAQSVTISANAQDAASPLRRAEYSINAGPWRMVEAADGITDSRAESYEIRIAPVPRGETTVVVRVLDSAGNPGLARVVLN